VRQAILGVCLLWLSGCQAANHFYAEERWFGQTLPDSLRVAATTNPQTVDLSQLASNNTGSDVIVVGDLLEVTIAAGLHENDQVMMSARVQEDGTLPLPEIGAIDVIGVDPEGAESIIRSEAMRQQLFLNPTVTVSVKKKRMNVVTVLGAVKAPGRYELSPNSSDVIAALAAAQGLAEDAGQNIEVRNPVGSSSRALVSNDGTPVSPVSSSSAASSAGSSGGMTSYSINLVNAAKAGNGQYPVLDGGVVHVEKRDPAPIYVQGLVKTPNRYEFPVGQDLHLLDAIALANGMSNQLADKIFVVRQVAGSTEPAVIQVSYRDVKRSSASNLRLQPGDVVSVEQTPATVFMEALNLIRFGINGSTVLF
jgi:polysaccharide export outer membrane protein